MEISSEKIPLLCNVTDESLLAASRESELTGSLSPLVKQELKLTIQARRHLEGKSELPIVSQPVQDYALRPDEIEKKCKRKEQNKQASKRHRQREKDVMETLKKKIQKLESGNTSLRNEIYTLKKQKNRLQGELHSHFNICHGHHT